MLEGGWSFGHAFLYVEPMNRFFVCLLLAFAPYHLSAQQVEPGTIPWTPVIDTGLVRVQIDVPPKFAALNLDPNVHFVYLPKGWTASVFYAGQSLNKPRFMAWGPDSVLFVANMNRNNVLALPDVDKDGIADDAIVATTTSAECHDIAFFHDTLYLSQEAGVTRTWRSTPGGYQYNNREVLIDKSGIPVQIGGGHRTRTLVLDTAHRKVYVSVGSRGNADREVDRALIEEFNWDGSGRRIFASGIRNAVGMTLHPRTGKLWANNNGSDLLGDNLPPEWFDIVRDGGFYGYPIAHHHQVYVDFTKQGYGDLLPITAQDSANVRSMVPPAGLIWAHCAPMAVEFSHDGMPAPYQHGAFMALRGSWNRQPISGSKIVYFAFDDDADTIANAVYDFCTGFLQDSNNVGSRWARPVGLALASDGSIYVSSDDLKQFILKLTPPRSTSVGEGADHGLLEIEVEPNPASDTFTVHTFDQEQPSHLDVFDLDGRKITSMSGTGDITVSTSMLTSGSYIVQVSRNGSSTTRQLQVLK